MAAGRRRVKHAGPSLQNYGTPWVLVRALERELRQRFTLDAAAEKWNAKARAHFDKDADGLAQKWFGLTWCNPPYADQKLWLEKALVEAQRGVRVVMLLKAATSERYWKPIAYDHGTVDLVHGRIAFIDPRTRRPKSGADFASAFVHLGPGVAPRTTRYRDARTGELLDNEQRKAA